MPTDWSNWAPCMRAGWKAMDEACKLLVAEMLGAIFAWKDQPERPAPRHSASGIGTAAPGD